MELSALSESRFRTSRTTTNKRKQRVRIVAGAATQLKSSVQRSATKAKTTAPWKQKQKPYSSSTLATECSSDESHHLHPNDTLSCKSVTSNTTNNTITTTAAQLLEAAGNSLCQILPTGLSISLLEIRREILKRARSHRYEKSAINNLSLSSIITITTSSRRKRSAGTCYGTTTEAMFFFYQSTAALAIYAILAITLVLQRSWFLYGILCVLWIQIAWISLKWMLYIADDPDWHKSYKYLAGWVKVFIKDEALHRQHHGSHSGVSLWLAGTVARELSFGMTLGQVLIRQWTKTVHQNTLRELSFTSSRFRQYQLARRKQTRQQAAAVQQPAPPPPQIFQDKQ